MGKQDTHPEQKVQHPEDPPVSRAPAFVCRFSNVPQQPPHEHQTHLALARKVAGLMELPFREGGGDPGTGYYVPDDTIVGIGAARSLGILSEDHLFGGVVPYAFVATKAISHPLAPGATAAPEGWSDDFAKSIQGATLRGFTAFSCQDTLLAAEQLLAHGPLRFKPTRARAGRGQIRIRERAELARVLDGIEADELAEFGAVLEEDLSDVTTLSVGQVRIAGMMVSYVGTQRLTHDNCGELVYGGSDLEIVRGDFDALLHHQFPDEARLAVAEARRFDAAADANFPGFLASRRNYDVAQGTAPDGSRRSGVLEQSWRIGGASTAEVMALQKFRDDPTLGRVRATSAEAYGEDKTLPVGAAIFFHGHDAELGFLTKYATVEPHGNAM